MQSDERTLMSLSVADTYDVPGARQKAWNSTCRVIVAYTDII